MIRKGACGAVLAAVCCLALGWVLREPAPGGAAVDLQPGRTVAGRLTGTERALYRIELRTEELLHAVLEQQGVDAVLNLSESDDPDDAPLLAMDSPNGSHGPEHLFFVAERDGFYFLDARALEADASGDFTLRIELRAASPLDRVRASACRAVSEADAAREGAQERYRHAILGWHRSGERYLEALTRQKLGKAHRDAGDLRAAALHLRRALALVGELGLSVQEPALHNDLGVVLQRLGQIDTARSLFETASAGARRQGNHREATAAANNQGTLEQEAGEPWKALQLLEEALAGWRRLGDEREEAKTLHNLGTVYTVLGKLPEAKESLEEALRIYRALESRRDEAATIMALAWVRFYQGDTAAAHADLEASLYLRRAAGDQRGEAVSLDRLGTFSRETGDLPRAIAFYLQALDIHERLEDQQGKAKTLSNLSEAVTLQGNAAAGLRCQNLALQTLEGQGQPSAEAYSRFRRAEANWALGRLEEAWSDIQKAIAGLEKIRERAESDDLRRAYLDSVHEQFELAVELLMELHRRQPGLQYDRLALEMAERAQARSLLDLVHTAHDRRAAERLDEVNSKLHQLEEELRTVDDGKALASVEGRGGSSATDLRVRRLLQEREKALVELRQKDKDGSLPARPLALTEIQQLLDDETVLLVYFLGERQSFVWAVGRSYLESAELPPRAQIESAASRYHQLLAESHRQGNPGQLALTERELSTLLLGKISHRLNVRRIVVIANGPLAYVPFGALPDPAGEADPEPEPLVARHEVVREPSASVLAAVRTRAEARPAPNGLVAVVADPVFSQDDPRVTPGKVAAARLLPDDLARAAQDLGFRDLARLPDSGREAAAILALAHPAPSMSATGFAANLELVQGGRLGDFRIVHFASHALIHSQYPELSGVVLSLLDEQGRPRAGFLRSYQIFSLHLPADLLVLSACRTGLGLQLQGEGLVGLTHSFFHAGASRVVVSLWDVNDEATAQLMKIFYRELLQKHRPPAEALHAAQLALRADPRWAAPYYWAGWELQGDWRELAH